ncbi:GSCOCG00010642001-RA-CDS, partial [Cotesia congregata]
RIYLYNSLVKAGCLYGVEIWGWDEPKKIKTFYNRINRMSLRVARNTPAYIIRQEVGIEHMEYIIKERALRFLADVVRMDDDRWTKICIKNEMREIMNKNPTKPLW